ncbi:hypothetical protein CCR87_00060 [Rhodobaculum claviforme]|uniref:Peptidoglycan binding-like domain-containing protein n=1 Tax=Rhodobaculum claviforme TaxID=1549854 RepID=A0A934TG29_9RHOB|nr:hypothetical protein [Rhodobaculum claviforme]
MKGVGRLSCTQFLTERAAGSDLYWNIGGWIDGYASAYNAYVPETYDISPHAPGTAADTFSVFLAKHCEQHPQDPIGLVLKSLLERLHAIRVTDRSEVTTVAVDGKTYQVYASVLAHVQQALIRDGYYDGTMDGKFGPKLQAALSKFQADSGMPANGAPTEATMVRILFADLSSDSATR